MGLNILGVFSVTLMLLVGDDWIHLRANMLTGCLGVVGPGCQDTGSQGQDGGGYRLAGLHHADPPLGSGAPTLSLGLHSALVCPWATEGHMLPSLPVPMRTSDSCQDASLVGVPHLAHAELLCLL